jgi:hypothetical protein
MNTSKNLFFLCLLYIQSTSSMAAEIVVYEGTCHNVTSDADGHVKLVISNENDRLTGIMCVSGWLMGGGRVVGLRKGAEFKFTSTDPTGVLIEWKGVLQNDKLSGEYIVKAQGGLPREVGEWSAEMKGKSKRGEPLDENATTAMLKIALETALNAPVKEADGQYISGAHNVFKAVHPAGSGVSIWVENIAVEWKTERLFRKLEDIHKFRADYILYWQGVITSTGWTRLRLTYNANIDAITSHKVVESTGTTNNEADEIAFGIGFMLGKAAMESMLGVK